MAKSKKMQSISDTRRRVTLRKLSSQRTNALHGNKKHITASEKKEYDDAICSVCMEYPHNAVLLLCSSYDKGCRPYMCATSDRYSNCLKLYKKTKTSQLLCPLCRGQVKGWTVVERARSYLNAKKRSCMQERCSFKGTFKELKKHVMFKHPLSRPREVDPYQAKKWKKLESERELSDVYSTIRSTMPGAIVIGDYVVERDDSDDSDDSLDDSFLIPRFNDRRRNDLSPIYSSDEGYD